MNISKKAIAREWVLLLASLIVGFLTTWGLFYNSSHKWSYPTPRPPWERYSEKQSFDPDAYLAKKTHTATPKRFDDILDTNNVVWDSPIVFTNDLNSLIEHLTGRGYWKQVWFSILFLYLIIQILRSIIWSIRILRAKQ